MKREPNGAAVAAITACFGADIGDQATGINRNRLGNLVFTNPEKKVALEAILHPLVRQHKDQFIKQARRHRKSAVFLDVPLLFETGGDQACDFVITIWSPAFIQRQRALRRDGMTPEKLHAIVQAQYLQPDKKQMSDLALPSSLGRAETNRRLRKWLKSAKLL
ncbi:MAG: dephospho-CoA kinase [Candidatus Puniceispirillaceae bacterium]